MKQTSFFRLTFLCLLVIIGLAAGNGCSKHDPPPPPPPPPVDLSKPPVKQWDKVFGGTNTDVIRFSSVKQTKDGGYIFGGYSQSGFSGNKITEGKGGLDYWVVKTDANGNKQWENSYGGTGDDTFVCLQQTSDGGYILGGGSTSGVSSDKTQPVNGVQDCWVVKVDANGVKEWDKSYGGDGDDLFTSLQQTGDGGYIFGGIINSSKGGDVSQPNQGQRDYWMVKTDANGNKQWERRFGGAEIEYLWTIKQTSDNGYIMGGYTFSSADGDKSQASFGGKDCWIVKVDKYGNKQWDHSFGGSGHEELYALQQTTDGGYILGAYSNSGSSGNKSEPNKGEDDFWVIKLHANGTKQWEKVYGGSAKDFLYGVQQTADGGFVLGGGSASPISGDQVYPGRGNQDFWLLKIDAVGDIKWSQRYGGSDMDVLIALYTTTDCGFILGGESRSDVSGDKTQPNQGGNDFWIIKLEPPTTP